MVQMSAKMIARCLVRHSSRGCGEALRFHFQECQANAENADRVMKAMLQMRKVDIAALKQA
jgi:hypothetical protein